jgi:16S rRNA processing protein RimM
VVLGKITGAFGIQGWVKVESYTDPPDRLLKYKDWLLGNGREWRAGKALTGKLTNKGLQVQMDGVTDRTVAARLAGTLIGVPRQVLPPTKAGEYYWDDLLGLDAFSPSGEKMGTIRDIRATSAHPLLQIVSVSGGKEREYLVPLVRERLLAVDLDARRVTVDWESGW